MNDMNLNESPSQFHDNYQIKLARFGLAGWALAAFFATLCFIQFLTVVNKPIQAVGVDSNGVVIGAVVFDEPDTRSLDRLTGDLKRWTEACVSENKLSVYEDMALCVTHYSEDLFKERVANSKDIDVYVADIAEQGCEKTETLFDEGTVLEKVPNTAWVRGEISGKILCNDNKRALKAQEFKIRVVALSVLRTNAKPLGLEVHKYEDIK